MGEPVVVWPSPVSLLPPVTGVTGVPVPVPVPVPVVGITVPFMTSMAAVLSTSDEALAVTRNAAVVEPSALTVSSPVAVRSPSTLTVAVLTALV